MTARQAPRILATANQKGGVGKSTTTFHLARAAVTTGQRVLVVDADPQGSLTTLAAAETLDASHAGLADVLSSRSEATAADVLVAGVWDDLDVLPTSGTALGTVRDELVIAGAGRETRLHEALQAVAADYDLILIDCPPSLDQLTINALVAAHGVVVVTHAGLLSTNGFGQLLETIETVKRYYNPTLAVSGILVNQHEGHTVSGAHWLSELSEIAQARGLAVLIPPIPKRVAIRDSAEAAVGLDQWGSAEGRELANIYATHLPTL